MCVMFIASIVFLLSRFQAQFEDVRVWTRNSHDSHRQHGVWAEANSTRQAA